MTANDKGERLSIKSRQKIDILLSFGAHKELDTSLSKLIGFQIAKYKSSIHQIKCELRPFEQKYNLSSQDFHQKFESGNMGDAADFFEWVSLCENILQYESRIQSLEAVLEGD